MYVSWFLLIVVGAVVVRQWQQNAELKTALVELQDAHQSIHHEADEIGRLACVQGLVWFEQLKARGVQPRTVEHLRNSVLDICHRLGEPIDQTKLATACHLYAGESEARILLGEIGPPRRRGSKSDAKLDDLRRENKRLRRAVSAREGTINSLKKMGPDRVARAWTRSLATCEDCRECATCKSSRERAGIHLPVPSELDQPYIEY